MDEKGNETIMADEDIGREGSNTDSRDAVEEKELPETADRIHKPSILERLKQEKAQQNTAEQPSVQKAAKKKPSILCPRQRKLWREIFYNSCSCFFFAAFCTDGK